MTKERAIEIAKMMIGKRNPIKKELNALVPTSGKRWIDMTDAQKQTVVNRLKLVYEHFGFPVELQLPVLVVAHVINFCWQKTNTADKLLNDAPPTILRNIPRLVFVRRREAVARRLESTDL